MKDKVFKWIDRILSIDLIIASICMVILVVLTFVGAIRRYFVHSPIFWMEEVQTWMILWAIFCGSSYAFRKGAHVVIDVLTDTFSPKMQRVVMWFGYACTMAALVFFFYYSLQLNIQFVESGKLTTVLRMESWIVYSMASIGSLWMAISVTYYTIRERFFPDTVIPTEHSESAERGSEE